MYPRTSPYCTTGVTNGVLDSLDYRDFPSLSTDTVWTITPAFNHRPDLLAFDLYGDAALWWIFSHRNPNKLDDPLFDFTSGTTIFIPDINTLKAALGF